MPMKIHTARVALQLLLITGVSAAGQAPSSASLEKEAALGKRLAEEFRGHTTKIDNSAVQAFLDRIGQRLAAQMPEARFPFSFSAVADDPCSTTHEPSALPGGYVFVPSRLFLVAENEAEFAGMLAHAMEHVVQRPIVFPGGFQGNCSGAIPLGARSSERSLEMKADTLAIQALARAGFDSNGLARYIQRIQIRRRKRTDTRCSSRDERVAAMRAAIGQLGSAVPDAGSSVEFTAVQNEVRALSQTPEASKDAPSLKRNTSK